MKYLQSILLLLFFLSFASASSINYTIIDEKTLVEINLENIENLELLLPEDYSALDKSKDFTSYVTSSLVEESGKKMLFLVSEKIINKVDEVNLVLPEGYFLSEGMPLYPKEYQTFTDGHTITINFQKPIQSEILVFYEAPKNNLFYFFVIILSIIGIVIYLFFRKYLDKRKNLTKNLFREEKKIVEFLIKNKKKGVWTKEISTSLEIPKVRLSRKLRSLEEKGIIKKEPFGNENKIYLKN